MESSSPGVSIKTIAIVPVADPAVDKLIVDMKLRKQYPFSYRLVLCCLKRLLARGEHPTMKADYTKERIAEVLLTFVKLYENFVFATPSLRKHGFQYILPVELAASLSQPVPDTFKAAVLNILNVTEANGCTVPALLEDFIPQYESCASILGPDPPVAPLVEQCLTCIEAVFVKCESESTSEKAKVRKVPLFVGAEIGVSNQDAVYQMLHQQLSEIKKKLPSSSSDLDSLLESIATRSIHHSTQHWRPPPTWHINAYYLGKQCSTPDSEYLKKYVEGVEVEAKAHILVYVPNELILSVVSCPNLRLHSSVKVPHVVWLVCDGKLYLGAKICQRLFESYDALGNLYLSNFFLETSTNYCQTHTITIGATAYQCHVLKFLSHVAFKADTKLFYNS